MAVSSAVTRRYIIMRRNIEIARKWSVAPLAIVFFATEAFAVDDSQAEDGWRTYINDSCIVTDEPFLLPETDDQSTARIAPLLALVATRMASTLVGSIITGFTGGVSAKAASRDTNFITTNDFNLYRTDLSDSPAASINPRLGCITVVAARFQANPANCKSEYIPRTLPVEALNLPESEWQTDRTDNSIENILKRANVCVVGQAKSVYEARIEFSEDKTAYRMNNAGYWINSLSSTKSTRAARNLLYTLEIVEPSEGSGGRVLSTAWVDLGMVSAGATAVGGGAVNRSNWLSVPPMSRSALQAHEVDTAAHQDVSGQIEALERAVVRDERQLEGIKRRAESASDEIREGLEKEISKIGVGIITKESMLEARRAEYEDLPQPTLLYMPVTMRFGITESRSNRRAMQVLSFILEANQEVLTETANEIISIDRSLDLDSDDADMETLRQEYFDALVAVSALPPDSEQTPGELAQELASAKDAYNAARIANGLDPVD